MGIVKTGLAVVGGIVILGVGIGACTSSNEEAKPTVVKQEAPAPKKEASKLTKENFDKIKQGDALTGKGGSTAEEVIASLGEPNTSGENQIGDTKFYNMAWTSISEGISITVTLTNDHVSSKSFSKIN